MSIDEWELPEQPSQPGGDTTKWRRWRFDNDYGAIMFLRNNERMDWYGAVILWGSSILSGWEFARGPNGEAIPADTVEKYVLDAYAWSLGLRE